jgi:hypothetical protein
MKFRRDKKKYILRIFLLEKCHNLVTHNQFCIDKKNLKIYQNKNFISYYPSHGQGPQGWTIIINNLTSTQHNINRLIISIN